jgi:uncharacterized protein with PIN domain
MLGSLARWLRILGFDVSYDPSLDDGELVRRAAAGQRVLLTRDTGLVRRRLARHALLVTSTTLPEQLRQVCTCFGIRPEPDRLFRRCLRCNVPLRNLSREAAAARVPPYVARTQERFQECPGCRRVYWRATHVESMLARLRALGLAPADAETPTAEPPDP